MKALKLCLPFITQYTSNFNVITLLKITDMNVFTQSNRLNSAFYFLNVSLWK